MTIDEIVNYVMYTSYNTNPAVLRDLLNSVESDGGGDTAFVHFTMDTQTSQLEADKTFAECVAESAKMMHQMPLVAECFGIIGPLFPKTIDGSVVAFTWTVPRSYLNRGSSGWVFDGGFFISVLYTADGVTMRPDDLIYSLPLVSSTDNGKVLTVVEGAWTAARAGGVLVAHVDETMTLDKTWREINAAAPLVFISSPDGIPGYFLESSSNGNGYFSQFFSINNRTTPPSIEALVFGCESADGYPSFGYDPGGGGGGDGPNPT